MYIHAVHFAGYMRNVIYFTFHLFSTTLGCFLFILVTVYFHTDTCYIVKVRSTLPYSFQIKLIFIAYSALLHVLHINFYVSCIFMANTSVRLRLTLSVTVNKVRLIVSWLRELKWPVESAPSWHIRRLTTGVLLFMKCLTDLYLFT